MPPKRSSTSPKAVEDVQDGGGAAAKRKRFIPRKIVRGEVESAQAAPPAATRPSATAGAAAGDTTIAVSASTSSGCTASTAGQPSVSNSPTVGLEPLPAERTRVAYMKAREQAERKRSGVLDRSTYESDDDEPYVRDDGDNDTAYNSPGRRRLSAGKRVRWRRSATAAGITDNDFDDSDGDAVLTSKSKRLVKKTHRSLSGSPSKQPVEAAVTVAARPAAQPATAASLSQPMSLASQPSDPLPVTIAVTMACDSAASGAADRLPASQSSPSVSIVRVPPTATTNTITTAGSALLHPAAQLSPNVVLVADAAAAPLPAAPCEPVGECNVLSSAMLPTAVAGPPDAVFLLVAEAADGFRLSNLSGESAFAVAGILIGQVIYPSHGMPECDDPEHRPANEHESDQPSQLPITVAALNDDGDTGDQGKGRRSAAAGSAVPAEQLTDEAAAAAVGDRAQSSKPKTVKCSTCHKLVKRYQLKKHFKNVHSDDKPHKCPHCDYAATWKGEKPYLCVICDKKFTRKTNMDTHIQSVHLKIKPFRCGFCQKGFGGKKLLERHVLKCHIHNAPMSKLTDDDEEDVDGDEVDDDQELSGSQAPAAEGGWASALLKSIVQFAATSSVSHAAAAAGVSAAVPRSSSSASATTTAAQAATTSLVYLRMPDGNETAAQAVKQYVVIHQKQVHGGGDVAVDHDAGSSSTAASMNSSTFTLAVDGNSSGHSINSSAAIVRQPAGAAAAAAGGGAEGADSLQQQAIRQQQQQPITSANTDLQFKEMPAGSVLQAVQAINGTTILLTTPASPSSLASVAGGHQQRAVSSSADGTPETILAVETVGVSADVLLVSRDREAAEEQQRYLPDGTA